MSIFPCPYQILSLDYVTGVLHCQKENLNSLKKEKNVSETLCSYSAFNMLSQNEIRGTDNIKNYLEYCDKLLEILVRKRRNHLSNSLNLPSTIAGTFLMGFISEIISERKKKEDLRNVKVLK